MRITYTQVSMEDPENTQDSVEESIEKLEEKVEQLENQTQGRNQVQMQAYDIRVNASSEDTEMRELIQMTSAEIEQIMRTSMMAEYQELEEQNLFEALLGGE